MMLVEWFDSSTGIDWKYKENISDPMISPVISFGILIRETDKEIVLLPNRSVNHILHEIGIPKGAIKRMRQLKLR